MPPDSDRQSHGSSLGDYLAGLRGARGMTLREVEEATNREVSNGYLSQLENNKINKPSPNILYALASVYGASYEDLMERAGYIVAEPKRSSARRQGRVATFLTDDFTPEEEAELLKYAAFIRSQRKR